jgi:Phosphotransferase enzyme family
MINETGQFQPSPDEPFTSAPRSGRRSGAMSQSRRSLAFAAAPLALWGFPAGTGIAPADEQGTNNRTFLVCHGQQRCVLRVSGFLSVAEVRAEHRILRRLRQCGLPFQVPEPVAAPGGRAVIATTDGPAGVSRWLPGVPPAWTSWATPTLSFAPATARDGRTRRASSTSCTARTADSPRASLPTFPGARARSGRGSSRCSRGPRRRGYR